jgi:hypothetical protein
MSSPGEAVAGSLKQPVMAAVAGDASRRVFVRLAYACAFITFAGFTPTYWVPLVTSAAPVAPVVHLHGVLYFAWMLLFVAQARWAASGRLRRHRAFGFVGISLATAMLFAGAMVVTHSIRLGIERGYGDQARSFAIVPASLVVAFGIAVAFAIANARKPAVHMRLMVVASVAILPPAIARILFTLMAPPGGGPGTGPPPPLAATLVVAMLANLVLVAAMLHDWRRRGRPHAAYLVSGLGLIVVQVGRIPLAETAAWHAVTEWLLRLFG